MTGYRGVSFAKDRGLYRAKLRHQDRDYNLGFYASEETAARVWDAAAIIVRGPGTKINFDGRLPVTIPVAYVIQRLVRGGLDPEDFATRESAHASRS